MQDEVWFFLFEYYFTIETPPKAHGGFTPLVLSYPAQRFSGAFVGPPFGVYCLKRAWPNSTCQFCLNQRLRICDFIDITTPRESPPWLHWHHTTPRESVNSLTLVHLVTSTSWLFSHPIWRRAEPLRPWVEPTSWNTWYRYVYMAYARAAPCVLLLCYKKNDFCLLSWRNMWTQEFGTSLCALVKFTQENVVISVIYRFHGRKDFPSFTWMETLHLNSHPQGRLKQITRGRATIHELVLLVNQNLKKIRGREFGGELFRPSVSIVEYVGGESGTMVEHVGSPKKNRGRSSFHSFFGWKKI